MAKKKKSKEPEEKNTNEYVEILLPLIEREIIRIVDKTVANSVGGVIQRDLFIGLFGKNGETVDIDTVAEKLSTILIGDMTVFDFLTKAQSLLNEIKKSAK